MGRRLGWSKLRTIFILIVGVLITLTTKTWLQGRAALRLSEDFATAGDVEGSISLSMMAAMAYVPGAPHVEAAYERLRKTAIAAELSGDLPTALLAWQAIRGATLGSRHVVIPFATRKHEADEHIVTLLAGQPSSAVQREKSREQRLESLRVQHGRELGPKPLALCAFYVGLVGFLWGSFRLLASMALDPDQVPPAEGKGRRIAGSFLVAALGAIGVLLGIWKA